MSAPVGQMLTHWPQNSQSRSFSKGVETLAANPRPAMSIAPTPWISSHTRTHLPQRMHFSMSRSMKGFMSFFVY